MHDFATIFPGSVEAASFSKSAVNINMADVDMKDDSDQDATWLSIEEDSGEDSITEREPEFATMDGSDTNQPATRQLIISSVVRSKKEAAPKLPDWPSALPFRQRNPTWSTYPDGVPLSFDFTFPPLTPEHGLYYSPTSKLLPRKSKKRDSEGNVKEMIAELNTRTDLVISRKSSPSSRGGRFDRALPSPDFWRWDTLGPSPLLSIPSPVSPRRNTTKSESPSRMTSDDVKECHEEGHDTEIRKRKGSLLEWRNKALFEEPIRI